jgi:hypothetical protein
MVPGPPRSPLTGVQLVALLPLLDWPDGQAVHTRSAVAEGGLDTKVPAAQSVHSAQEGVLEIALKVPSAQFAQAMSLVPVAGALTYIPAGHWPTGVQLAALLPLLN